MKRSYGAIIYLIIFMYSAGEHSRKSNLFKFWTAFPPQISCMGRIFPCRLMMKVMVMLVLSSVPMFPLLVQNFNLLTSFLKNKHKSTIFYTVYNETLCRRKNKKILSSWFALLNNTKSLINEYVHCAVSINIKSWTDGVVFW